jgi:hypothetical protein
LVDQLCFDLNDNRGLLLESENMFMKFRIQQLEFELETEKIRSRHFEGLSEIAMLELKRGNWVKSCLKRRKVCEALVEVERIRVEMINYLSKLESVVSSVKNDLE